MISNERHEKIIRIVENKKVVSVKELCETVYTSEATMRRDLKTLEKQGLLTRTRGGAMIHESLISETSVVLRQQVLIKEKKKMAEKCLQFIQDGDSYFIDSSTSAGTLIPLLTKFKDLFIVTNGVNNALLLSAIPGITVLLSGGVVSPKTNSVIGAKTNDFINSYNCNFFIFSCTGISVNGGITEGNAEQAASKINMIKNSKKHILLVDHTKFGLIQFAKTCTFDELDIVITNKAPSDDYIQLFESHGIQLIIAN